MFLKDDDMAQDSAVAHIADDVRCQRKIQYIVQEIQAECHQVQWAVRDTMDLLYYSIASSVGEAIELLLQPTLPHHMAMLPPYTL